MLLLLIPIIGIALTAMLVSNITLTAPSLNELRAAAAAQSMAIYRQAVSDWASVNPALTQAVPDASLVFPYGYTKSFAWTNIVTNGHGWIYTTDPTISGRGGMASALLIQSEYSMQVGTNAGGVLWSPRAGNLNIPINAAVPNGSLVWGF